MSLLIRPHLTDGEGPQGFLFRVAEANGLGLAALCELGMHFDVQLLDNLGFFPLQSVSAGLVSYAKSLERHLVHQPQSWNREVARYCPECLRDKACWQFGWEILFFDACPIHGTWLIDRCPACNEHLSWGRPEMRRCACGAMLGAYSAAPCPESVTRLTKALAHCVMPEETGAPVQIAQTMSLIQLQRLIRLLGAYGDPVATPRPQKILGTGRLDISWNVTSLAAEILEKWPQSFFLMLSHMEGAAPKVGSGRLNGRFGHFYSLLYRGFPEPEFDFLRRAFEEYVAEHWKGSFGGRNRRLIDSMPRKMAWIPAKHARQILGISQRALDRLVTAGELSSELRYGQTGRSFLYVNRREVEVMADSKANSVVDLVTASSLLGLKKSRVAALILLLMPEVRKLGEVGSVWKIPRTLIDEVLAIGAALPVRPSLKEGEVSLGHVIRYWPWSDRAFGHCIEACIKGDILPVAHAQGSRGIKGWLFKSNELKAWHTSRARNADSYSIPELAERFSIKQEVAYFLVRKNLIKAERVKVGRKTSALVSVENLDEFERRYVFGRDLAAELEISPKAISEKLASLGVCAVSGPGVDGCRQVLFAKSVELNSAIVLLSRSLRKFATHQ